MVFIVHCFFNSFYLRFQFFLTCKLSFYFFGVCIVQQCKYSTSFILLLFFPLILLNIRPETPPNTPQRVRIAAQRSERDSRVLDSPEHRRLSEPHGSRIPPPRLNLPNIPAPVPASVFSNNNADPFAAPGQPTVYNGQTYNHLPPDLAARMAAMTAMPAPARRQRRNFQNLAPPLPPIQPVAPPPPPQPVYNNLPANLAAQLAALPAMRAPQQRQNHQVNPAPPPPPPPPVQNYNHLPYELAAQMAHMPAMPSVLRQRAIDNPAPFPMPPPIEPDAPPSPPPFIEPDELPPPPENTNALPEARKPFNRNWPVHSLGKMDVKCSNCQALHWMDERLVRSTKQTPLFGMCCTSGKIKLPKLEDPPGEILNLLSGQDHISKQFRQNI